MPGRVVLAMSGGVDSSVAAVLLKRQGFDVVDLLRVPHDAPHRTPAHGKRCQFRPGTGREDATRSTAKPTIPMQSGSTRNTPRGPEKARGVTPGFIWVHHPSRGYPCFGCRSMIACAAVLTSRFDDEVAR